MEEIKPAFFKNNIAVCFSVNDAYIPLMAVTLQSIIENSSPENNYDIIVLMTDVSSENQSKIFSMISKHINFVVRFINVGALVYGYNFFIESDPTNTKYSNEIYFRILVPTLMSAYSKAVFLDSDVVVNEDIANLYNIDLADNMISAVRDYEGIASCYHHNYARTKYRINELGIKNFENYFISGVVVINIKKFSEIFTEKTLLNMAVSKNWIQFDQDLLNYICKDSVKIIDSAWDFVEDIDETYSHMPDHLYREYLESEKNPKIIHYSGSRKPWKNPGSKFNKYFDKYLDHTPFKDEIRKFYKFY